ncbi:MAG: hypothetical protein WD875_18885 [Pirellulales bacterium]
MNEFAQQVGVVLAVAAATVYLAMSCWRRTAGLGRAGGCGGCAKCPASGTAADGASTDGASMAGKTLPLVNIDLSSASDDARRTH